MSLTDGINYKDQTLLELVLLSILTIFEFQVRLLSKVSKKNLLQDWSGTLKAHFNLTVA